jgi:hypothetical protein
VLEPWFNVHQSAPKFVQLDTIGIGGANHAC